MSAEDLLRLGREAWPGVEVAADRFAAFLADDKRDASRAAELYLVCACADGDAAALRCFEDAYFADARAAIARTTSEAGIADEALQQLRRRLFVADGRIPGIAGYTGRGDLRGWLRVAATRATLEILRARKPADGDGAALERLADASADPELALMRREYGSAAAAALLDAFTSLETRERNLLRQYFVDGLNIDEVGKLYDVHRATAARWIEKARADLERRTRALLRERLGVTSATLESIVRMVGSDLHANLSGLR